MLKENESIKKDYFLARDTVQLADVDTVSISVNKNKPITPAEKKFAELKLKTALSKNNKDASLIRGLLESEIQVKNEKGELCAVLKVIQMGVFHAETDLDADEFVRRVNMQLVPQMLPYLRGLISVLAAQTGLAPLIMPTMDVLKSIKANSKTE